MAAAREDALVQGLLTGIAAFRWLAWAWMAIVLVVSRHELEGGGRGSRWGSSAPRWWSRRSPASSLGLTPVGCSRRRVIVTELLVGFALGAGDDWAFAGEHPQSLGSVWPLAGVMIGGREVGVAGAGRSPAAWSGLGRLFGDLVEERTTKPISELTVTASSTFVLYALGGRRRRLCRGQAARGGAADLDRAGAGGGGPHPPRRRAADTRRRPAPGDRSRPVPARPRPGARAARVPVRRRAAPAASWARAASSRRPATRTTSPAGRRSSSPTTCPRCPQPSVDGPRRGGAEALTNAGKHGRRPRSRSTWNPPTTAGLLLRQGRRRRLRPGGRRKASG